MASGSMVGTMAIDFDEQEGQTPLDPDEIAEIEQVEKIDIFIADLFRVNVHLNPSGGVAQIG